jgi:hypothetical protein
MKLLLLLAALVLLAMAQAPMAPPSQQPRPPHRFGNDDANPNSKPQQDEILKADHEQDLKDAGQLIALAEQLKQELEKNDRHVLSITSLKKTEEIEKLAKRIHSRMVH